MKLFFAMTFLISMNLLASDECSFSRVGLDKSASHYQSNGIDEDPREALIKNGFHDDLQSPNVAHVSQTDRERLLSVINPLTLGSEVVQTLSMLDSDYRDGWMNAGFSM